MLVFLIDLDGTIQGDVSSQVKEFQLIKELNKYCKEIKQNKKGLEGDLRRKLLRPGFQTFINFIKTTNIELFIYTASDKKWALHLIPVLEKIIDHKFNKPIFTRDKCLLDQNNTYYKSIRNVQPFVFKRLKKLHPTLTKDELDIRLIDNNYVLKSEEADKLIKCTTYKYGVICDPLRSISIDVIDTHVELLSSFLITTTTKLSSVWLFKKYFYNKMYRKSRKQSSINKMENAQDLFWKEMITWVKQY